jgi:hypothetical protein
MLSKDPEFVLLKSFVVTAFLAKVAQHISKKCSQLVGISGQTNEVDAQSKRANTIMSANTGVHEGHRLNAKV